MQDEEVTVPTVGTFEASLKRNNSKIREDRATTISEDAQMAYQRNIQDMELSYKKLQRKRNNMLDLSPTNADSLILGEDFDSKGFTDKDIQIGVDMRNLEIKLEIGYKRYKELFGVDFISTLKP